MQTVTDKLEGLRISGPDLSRLTGLTTYQLKALARQGHFALPANGVYELEPTLAGLFRHYREAGEGRARGSYQEAKTREAEKRGDLMDLELKHKSGDLITSETALDLIRASFQPVREAFTSLPISMAARVNPSDPVFAREALAQWVDDALRVCHEKALDRNGAPLPRKRGRPRGPLVPRADLKHADP